MLYQEISKTDFVDQFKIMNRSENFSREGLEALYGYFEELSDDQNIEFDVIAICCDFTEYNNLAEFNLDYGMKFDDIEEIFDHTQVIMINNEKFIIQNF
jgi:hypothetical protein